VDCTILNEDFAASGLNVKKKKFPNVSFFLRKMTHEEKKITHRKGILRLKFG